MKKLSIYPLVVLLFIFMSHNRLSFAQSEATNTKAIDKENMDLSVDANEDFYRYANGKWMEKNPVPPEYSRWGSFDEVSEQNRIVLKEILEEASQNTDAVKGSNTQKIGDLYYSSMDIAGRDAMKIEPIKEDLARIGGISDIQEYRDALAYYNRHWLGGLFSFYPGQDDKNSKNVIPQIYQGGLGLPDRDYYFKDDEKSQRIREEYVKHMTKMFELIGDDPVTAKANADAVMKLETRLAGASMTRVERRDPDATYNKMTLEELQELTPDFDWTAYFTELGLEMPSDFNNGVNVGQPEFFKEVNSLVQEENLPALKTYLRWRFAKRSANMLHTEMVNEDFRFSNTVLRGITKQRADWKKALNYTNRALGEALGELFVERTFSPYAKERALVMVDNIKEALRVRIGELDWMSEETKKKALEKLSTFKVKIGYPDEWRDYSALEIDRNSLLGNMRRASAFSFKRNVDKIGKPVKDEWYMTPQRVNAYYSASRNEIVFPAGILQPPFFSAEFDDAVNYGGIGSVIGHEITHGFDDQGSKYDAYGNLNDWWTPEDRQRYKDRAEILAAQFDDYIAIDTFSINGHLTLGENIADLGGLKIAYLALKKTLEGRQEDLIDGFTPEQRFFLSWAQIWRQNINDDELRLRLNTDSHSPGRYRAIGPVGNMDEFIEAFGGDESDPMIRPEEERVTIW